MTTLSSVFGATAANFMPLGDSVVAGVPVLPELGAGVDDELSSPHAARVTPSTVAPAAVSALRREIAVRAISLK